MRILKISAVVATLAAPLALHAAEPAKGKLDQTKAAQAKAAPAPAKPTPEQQKANTERGMKILMLFSSALREEKVPQDQKQILFSCLYNNKLEKISQSTGRLLEKDSKLDPNDPMVLYRAAGAACGIGRAASVKNAATAPAKAPAPTGAGQQGKKGEGR